MPLLSRGSFSQLLTSATLDYPVSQFPFYFFSQSVSLSPPCLSIICEHAYTLAWLHTEHFDCDGKEKTSKRKKERDRHRQVRTTTTRRTRTSVALNSNRRQCCSVHHSLTHSLLRKGSAPVAGRREQEEVVELLRSLTQLAISGLHPFFKCCTAE